jgi:hypothetical protein
MTIKTLTATIPVLFSFVVSLWVAWAGAEPSARNQAEMTWPGMILQQPTPRQAEETMRRFAQCIAKTRAADVKAFLALPIQGPEVQKAGAALAQGSASDCSPNFFMIIHANALRYALIEVLYDRDFHGPGNGVPSVQLGPDAGKLELAKCVVSAAPAAADALTVTPPASKREKAAFAALEPFIRSCRGPVSADAESRRWARYEISEALYRQRSASAPVKAQ